MGELEKNVRAIEKDGLKWGASKLEAVGYGVKKLRINLVVEDEKVSLDELQEEIECDEDHVQSTDIVSGSYSVVPLQGLQLISVRLLCRSYKQSLFHLPKAGIDLEDVLSIPKRKILCIE